MPFVADTARYISRRSTVYGRHGMVASSQPLASEIGLRILRQGGNAADAAIAVAAALNVTEPCSTGIGGDCFALFYDAKAGTVSGMNGSGRSPAALTRERVLEGCPAARAMPPFHVHTVTVPGAAAGWADAADRWGSMPLAALLEPAIRLADDGFPVSPIAAHFWAEGVHLLRAGDREGELMVDGSRAPCAGELFRNPGLARTFRALAEGGKDAFYSGRIAEAIVQAVDSRGGVMTLDVRALPAAPSPITPRGGQDLSHHRTTWEDPISVNYGGVDVFEIPPNGQGITALIALNVLQHLGPGQHPHNSAPYLHRLIELDEVTPTAHAKALRLAFADSQRFVADPDVVPAPVAGLLSPEYAEIRSKLFDPDRAAADVSAGRPAYSSDTVCFQVVDREGNCCSFINSNYMGFGSGIVPTGWGFTLQNRGANFSLQAGHPNVVAGGKRPYHTIIPGMALRGGSLFCGFSVMGGFMQPQGHVQVMLNMIERGMDPQAALDAPRVCLQADESGEVLVEDGIGEDVVAELRSLGHNARLVRGDERAVFGRGQIIARDPDSGVLAGGSDGRADGCAMGW